MHIRKYTVNLMECVLFFIIEKSINSMLTLYLYAVIADALHIIRFRITLPYAHIVCVETLFIILFCKSFTSIRKAHESEQELTKIYVPR